MGFILYFLLIYDFHLFIFFIFYFDFKKSIRKETMLSIHQDSRKQTKTELKKILWNRIKSISK